MAYLPSMMVELAAYGFVSGLMMQLFHSGKLMTDLYVSLVGAMLIGRIIAGVSRTLIFAAGSYSMGAWITSYFVTALPGIIVQLIAIPAIYFALEKAHLIPVRYSR